MSFHRPRALPIPRTVTVVIPCYRYGHYLATAVGSVLDQSDVDVDVLIVDDASPDDSAEVARRLADQDPRVSVLVHEQNAGHIATYNDGLARAKGEYVVLLSADDALTPGSLSRAVALMEAHPRVGFVYGFSRYLTDEPLGPPERTRSWSVWDGSTWLARMSKRAVNPVATPEVVMRRDAWEQVGPYDARVPHAADMLLWFATARTWDVGRVNGPAQAQYRVHGENMHLTQFSGMLRDLREQRAVFETLFAADPSEKTTSLHAAARRAMSSRALRLAEVERRGAHDEALIASYRSFAEETAPDPGSLKRAGRTARVVESAWAAPVRKVTTHLAWRRWRRYGT